MDKLTPGQAIWVGKSLESNSGRFKLAFQDNRNLVVFYDNNPIWATGTNDTGADTFAFQTDGNAVVYAGQNAVWSSNTQNAGATHLVLQDDGNLVVYAGGTPLWSSGVYINPPPPKIVVAPTPNTTTTEPENPLKLDAKWYCNCIGNGTAITRSTQAMDKFPEVRGVLLARNLNFGTQGLYPSPYCAVPSLAELEAQAIDRAMSFKCPRLWGNAKCDNRREELKQEYLAEARKKFDTMCIDAAREEALMIESIATKANTEAKKDIVDKNLSPEARTEAAQETAQQTKQMGWVLVAVVVGIVILAWQIFKK